MNISAKNLTVLETYPTSIEENFWCYSNELTSLEGAPKEFVGGHFDCSYNSLIDLVGAPKHVNGYFNCGDNDLNSLEGAPVYVGGDFYCMNNVKQFTEAEVRAVCDVGGNVYV